MAEETVFLCKTKGNSESEGKPRVFFTCHPDDFSKYFEKICADIFITSDCAIYYTEDQNSDLSNKNNEFDLLRMNLFVIPVTFKLLTQKSRVTNHDLSFAIKNRIPVLPLMMDTGIDAFYEKVFGDLHYISPFNIDETAISYEENLAKYLSSVLISSELAERIRTAFDAYIFLSYRKKDRKYAYELMRLIHKNPKCRDIAIWYDEFLTPGESFRKNIDRMLKKSKLFALLVTPNLLEKPNFVMDVEYKDARKSNLPILPAEAEQTDKEELAADYEGIPSPVRMVEEKEFKERFISAIERIAKSENNGDPKHNFLIGLAYLNGIDVEVNVDRGLNLIFSAAEAGLREAMIQLIEMYENGVKATLDYKKALYWAKKLVTRDTEEFGEEHPYTLASIHSLARAYANVGDYIKAAELMEKIYAEQCKSLGEVHPNTLTTLHNLAFTYTNLGDYNKALELADKLYGSYLKLYGENDTRTKDAEELICQINILSENG